MRTLTVASSKGGSGKSTVVQGLAVCAVQAGVTTIIVDVDPQGSTLEWAKRRGKQLGADPEKIVIASVADDLDRILGRLESDSCDLVLIDTPGARGLAIDSALCACDFALVPSAPTIPDLEGALPTARDLHRCGREFAYVLTSCPLGQQRLSDAEALLNRLAARAGEPIHRRVAYQDATARGLGVTEGRFLDRRAAAEMEALWQWVKARLGVGET